VCATDRRQRHQRVDDAGDRNRHRFTTLVHREHRAERRLRDDWLRRVRHDFHGKLRVTRQHRDERHVRYVRDRHLRYVGNRHE